MLKQIIDILERQVEKIVLALVLIICLWILFTKVIFSPNVVSYQNRKFGPGEIDNFIMQKATALKTKIEQNPQTKNPYRHKSDEFAALLEKAITDVDTSFWPLQPNPMSDFVLVNPVYEKPQIPDVNNVLAAHLRAVAYLPKEEINEKLTYEQVEYEPNGLDFVTVQAQFDPHRLFQNFSETFAGQNLKPEWRDPCLAKPVFAAVQLQRKKLLTDGKWSEWNDVPPTKINPHKDMLKIIENVEELPPGGVDVRRYRFDEHSIKRDILQPQAYQIASHDKEWFPPSIYQQYLQYLEDVQERDKKDEIKRKQLERKRAELEARAKSKRESREKNDDRFGFGDDRRDRRDRRDRDGRDDKKDKEAQENRKRLEEQIKKAQEQLAKTRDLSLKMSIEDYYDKLEELLIDEDAEISSMSAPLVFWAHDDSIEPDNIYRYRIRFGVFNPVAGKNMLRNQYARYNDNVIFWCEFSDSTKPVEVPARLYFFPHTVQDETTKTIIVKVSKWRLGHWYSKDFEVRPGEVIGKPVENKTEKKRKTETIEQTAREIMPTEAAARRVTPKVIDYSTGAVVVDIDGPVANWSIGSAVQERFYYRLLYTYDGDRIKKLPVRTICWPEKLYKIAYEIDKLSKKPILPFRSWGSRPDLRERTTSYDQAVPPEGYPYMTEERTPW